MTEQTSALKSKENNNVASKQPKPPMQKDRTGHHQAYFSATSSNTSGAWHS